MGTRKILIRAGNQTPGVHSRNPVTRHFAKSVILAVVVIRDYETA
jgi:hypothetical protein